MKAFLTEAVVLCLAFHLCVYLLVRFKPELAAFSYPPAIVQRLIDLGRIPVRTVPTLRDRIIKKIPAAAVIGMLLGFLLVRVNSCTGFISAFLTGYGLWLIVDWYDALVLDCLWFCHSPVCIMAGTEDLTEAYHDYGYHIKASAAGMLIGLPVCLIAALAVKIFALFF